MVKKESIAASRSRKLAVSSTRTTGFLSEVLRLLVQADLFALPLGHRKKPADRRSQHVRALLRRNQNPNITLVAERQAEAGDAVPQRRHAATDRDTDSLQVRQHLAVVRQQDPVALFERVQDNGTAIGVAERRADLNTALAVQTCCSWIARGYPNNCATRRIGTNNRAGWACRVRKP